MKVSVRVCLLAVILAIQSHYGEAGVCRDGWLSFQDRCYYYNTRLLSWQDAQDTCTEFGASLVSIHSTAEYAFLFQETTRFGFSPSWIGGIYFANHWMWLDGTWFRPGFFNTREVCHGAPSLYSCLATYTADGWCSYLCKVNLRSFCVMNP